MTKQRNISKLLVFYLFVSLNISCNSCQFYYKERKYACSNIIMAAKVPSLLVCVIHCERYEHQCERLLWNNVTTECFLHSENPSGITPMIPSDLQWYRKKPLVWGKLHNLN